MAMDTRATPLKSTVKVVQMRITTPVAPIAVNTLSRIDLHPPLNILTAVAQEVPQLINPSGAHGVLNKQPSPHLPSVEHQGTAIIPSDPQDGCKTGNVSPPPKAHTTASPAFHVTRAELQSDKEEK